jgi:succinate dehydrogenase / fumarate reductase, cytochrome b subunit
MTTKPIRPLSPHLQIYKPQLTALMSISHRLSGVFLSLSSLVLVYWLMAIAAGEAAYQQAQNLFNSWLGLIFLFGWSLALFYHLCNGIRHLSWDIGLGMDIKTVYLTGSLVWIATLLLTGLTWLLAMIMQ